MTNPVGISPRVGAPEGLDYCGTSLAGGAPNYLGGGAEDTVTGDINTYWYLRPAPAGVILVDGGPSCSFFARNAVDSGGGLWPYGPQPLNGTMLVAGHSPGAAAAAAAASCEYVTVAVDVTPGVGPGVVYCSGLTDGVSLNLFTLSMAGWGAVDAMVAPGGGTLPRPQATFAPYEFVGNATNSLFLLRPTALTWPGQDPDNQWNRAIWHASEIGELSWSMNASGWNWIVDFAWQVYGYQRRTSYPTPCPIVGGVLVPSTIAAGPGVAGLLAPPPPIGATAPAATTPAPPVGLLAGFATGRVAAGAPTTGLVAQEP